jgi:hypothetical protein
MGATSNLMGLKLSGFAKSLSENGPIIIRQYSCHIVKFGQSAQYIYYSQ